MEVGGFERRVTRPPMANSTLPTLEKDLGSRSLRKQFDRGKKESSLLDRCLSTEINLALNGTGWRKNSGIRALDCLLSLLLYYCAPYLSVVILKTD